MRKSINKSFGLPEDYAISFDDALLISERFKKATHGFEKITPISFVYYYDEYGDFMKPKKHYECIVRDMFKNLNNDTQFELLNYFYSKE